MPKINQEEYEVLKGLDDKWEWIARDKDGTLVMGAGKNERYLDGWFPPENIGDSLVADEINAVKVISEWENLFQFIQWEDESPYNIAELIEEYEKDYKGSWEHAIEFSGEVFGESEETEVKNIEWVKQEIKKERNRLNDTRYEREVDDLTTGVLLGLKKALNIFNQLDEPEVLSEEWIEENKEDSGVHYIGYYVPIGRLHDLLVPKQEEVDQAYKDGYETGKKHAFEKVGWKDKEPETVADVVINFWKSYERLKEVMNMEVEELEE